MSIKKLIHIPKGYYKRLAMAESSNDKYAYPTVRNKKTGEVKPASSARGLYQFTTDTWNRVSNKYNLNYSLDDRFDDDKMQKAAELLTKENEIYLKKVLGREPNEVELYLAHFSGMGRAGQVLKALNEKGSSVMAEDVYDSGQIAANKNLLKGKSLVEVYNQMAAKMKADILNPEELDAQLEERKYYNGIESVPVDLHTPEERKDINVKAAEVRKKYEGYPEDYIQLQTSTSVPGYDPDSEEKNRLTDKVAEVQNKHASNILPQSDKESFIANGGSEEGYYNQWSGYDYKKGNTTVAAQGSSNVTLPGNVIPKGANSGGVNYTTAGPIKEKGPTPVTREELEALLSKLGQRGSDNVPQNILASPPQRTEQPQQRMAPLESDPLYNYIDVNTYKYGGQMEDPCGDRTPLECEEYYRSLREDSRGGKQTYVTGDQGNYSFHNKPQYEGHEPSTHLMADDGKNIAWPAIYRDPKTGEWSNQSQTQAKKRGESTEWDTTEKMTDFARKGIWKKEGLSKYELGGQMKGSFNGPGDPPKTRAEAERMAAKWREFQTKGIGERMEKLLGSSADYSNYVHTTDPSRLKKGEFNCIHGSCEILREDLGGGDFISKNYKGNITFDDAEGSNWSAFDPKDILKAGFDKSLLNGTLLRQQVSAEYYAKMHPDGKAMGPHINDSNRYSPKVTHTQVIFYDPKTDSLYRTNNSGKATSKTEKVSLDWLKYRLTKPKLGKNNSSRESLFYYNPVGSFDKSEAARMEKEILEGRGPNAESYNGVTFSREGVKGLDLDEAALGKKEESSWYDFWDGDSDNVSSLLKVYNNPDFFNRIGKSTGLSSQVFKKMLGYQIGIAGQETAFGDSGKKKIKDFIGGDMISDIKNSSPEDLLSPSKMSSKFKENLNKQDPRNAIAFQPNLILTAAKTALPPVLSGAYNTYKGPSMTWVSDYANKNPEKVKAAGGKEAFIEQEKERFLEFLKSKKSSEYPGQDASKVLSKGVFQQKGETGFAKYHKADLNTVEGQAINSIGLMTENFKKAQKLYPDLTEDEHIEIATLMHSAPGLAEYGPYMESYFLNGKKDVDYINKVKNISKLTTR